MHFLFFIINYELPNYFAPIIRMENYIIQQIAGAGSFGQVRIAQKVEGGSKVAIKVKIFRIFFN